MNIVFFGSAKFGVPSLKALLASSHKVACVLTQPDRKKGRGLQLAGTAIKAIAAESAIDIYQPDKVNTPDTVKLLIGLNPDLFVVIAYGQILSSGLLNIPKKFCVNVHASLLPKYRGAAPINWAIIKGEEITGVTVIKMAEQMDAGPIILQKEEKIDADATSVTLEKKLSHLAAEALLGTLRQIEDNNYKLIPQDGDKATFAPKLKKEDGEIHWQKSSRDIHNLIRGCITWPGAFTYYKGKLLKVFKARVAEGLHRPAGCAGGEILEISREGITVAAGKGSLIIEELQIEGKRIMTAQEFIAGNKIRTGEIFKK